MNVLSLRRGPPMDDPNWLYRRGFLGWPVAFEKKFGASMSSLRKNSNADPCQLLVPDLVSRLTTPPATFPNSAEYDPACTENSRTASKGILKSFPRPSADDVTENPSTRNRLALSRWPFTFMAFGDPVSPGAPGFTPALSPINCCQLRPFNGISATVFSETTCEICAPSVESSCVPVASTCTESVAWPTVSAKSTRTVWFT